MEKKQSRSNATCARKRYVTNAFITIGAARLQTIMLKPATNYVSHAKTIHAHTIALDAGKYIVTYASLGGLIPRNVAGIVRHSEKATLQILRRKTLKSCVDIQTLAAEQTFSHGQTVHNVCVTHLLAFALFAESQCARSYAGMEYNALYVPLTQT